MVDNYPFDSSNVPYSAVFNQDYTADSALAVSTLVAQITPVSLITIAGGAGGTSAGVGGTGGTVTLLDSAYSTSRAKYSGGDGGTASGSNGAGGGGAAGYSGAGGDAGSAGTGGAGGGGGASTNQLLLGGGGVGLFGEGTSGAAGTASAAAGGGSRAGSDSAEGGFDGYFDSDGAQPNYNPPPPPNGLTSTQAATSAAQILSDYPNSTDGVYWINLPTVGPTQIYCIMNSSYDGGGWMLAMKATRGNTFSFTSSYWETNNTLNPTATNLSDGDAKYNSYNYFEGTDIMARFPDVTAGGTLGTGLNAWTWHENNFYSSGSSTTLLNHFTNTANNTYLLTGNNVTSWSGHLNGPFSSQAGWKRYGFNIDEGTALGQARSRWGFAWNNEATSGSNDVASGIGLANRVTYSAGDAIGCCQNYTGVNRSMRFEMYIR